MKDRKSVELELIKATSLEEAKKILADAGQEITDEEAKQILDRSSLSLDELEAVSGGAVPQTPNLSFLWRSKSKDGCVATVEEGSNCWGNDGGCWTFNYHYSD